MIRCISYELYKFMVQKKGIVLFMVYFIFKIISVVTSPGVQHNKENIRQKMYMDIYYSRWGGKLDSQKNSEIENMLVQIQNAQNKYDDMMSKKVNGELLQEEYMEITKETFPLIQQSTIFEQFYKSYSYCKNESNGGWLIKANAWQILFGLQKIDYVLAIIAILAGTMIFSSEFGYRGLEEIIKTTHYGKNYILLSKIVCLIIVSFLVEMISVVAEFTGVAVFFDFTFANAPIRSVPSMKNFKYDLTIVGAFVILFLVRLFALFYLEIIAAFLTELTKKSYLGFVLTFFSILLLDFIFGKSNDVYKMPYPVSMMQTKGFMLASEHIYVLMTAFLICICIIVIMVIHYMRKINYE